MLPAETLTVGNNEGSATRCQSLSIETPPNNSMRPVFGLEFSLYEMTCDKSSEYRAMLLRSILLKPISISEGPLTCTRMSLQTMIQDLITQRKLFKSKSSIESQTGSPLLASFEKMNSRGYSVRQEFKRQSAAKLEINIESKAFYIQFIFLAYNLAQREWSIMRSASTIYNIIIIVVTNLL